MRGRPSKSVVKKRLLNILFKRGVSYGYELYKFYEEHYGKTSLRNIYYNLKKGVVSGDLVVIDVKRVLGDYSWGDEVERTYYSLGPYAEVGDTKLNIKQSTLKPNLKIELNKLLNDIRKKFNEGFDKNKLINKCDKLVEWVKINFKEHEGMVSEINRIKNRLTP